MLSGTEIQEAYDRYRLWRESAGPDALPDPSEHQPMLNIEPFDQAKLNPNSYNLRLHEDLLVYEQSPPGEVVPWCLDMKKNNPTVPLKIPPEGLVMMPGVLYLGRTVEWTETYNLVPRLDGRSSTGRLGIFIHITASFGDNFFKGAWTLELGVIHPVRVYADTEICQISYVPIKPGGPQYRGRYQNSREVIASRFHLGALPPAAP
jgi:dCTP deaminase